MERRHTKLQGLDDGNKNYRKPYPEDPCMEYLPTLTPKVI